MRFLAGLALALLTAACTGATSSGGSSSSIPRTDAQTGPQDGGICHYPAGVQARSDASGSGCFAQTPGQICQVSSGATVLPDGGVSGGTESCTSLCGASQYEMTCIDTSVGPDPALGCQVIAIPTPSCCLYYCCPCAE